MTAAASSADVAARLAAAGRARKVDTNPCSPVGSTGSGASRKGDGQRHVVALRGHSGPVPDRRDVTVERIRRGGIPQLVAVGSDCTR